MQYASAAAFRMTLEERIRQRWAAEGTAIERMRKRVAIERFLARLQARSDSPWLLKGAFALDLRFRDRARTTKDIDLIIDVSLLKNLPLDHAEILQLLREAGTYPLPDFFIFSIPGEGEPILHEKGSRTYRFTAHAALGGRPFEEFKVDVSTRPELVAPVEEIPESDVLAFAGIVPGRFRAISLSQQFAEKVHALTFPWEDRENTRVKDLVDLILILELASPAPGPAKIALEGVFKGRATHPLPAKLPDPPSSWADSYTVNAIELGLSHTNIEDAIRLVGQFLQKLSL